MAALACASPALAAGGQNIACSGKLSGAFSYDLNPPIVFTTMSFLWNQPASQSRMIYTGTVKASIMSKSIIWSEPATRTYFGKPDIIAASTYTYHRTTGELDDSTGKVAECHAFTGS
jgi:hypothetical protein